MRKCEHSRWPAARRATDPPPLPPLFPPFPAFPHPNNPTSLCGARRPLASSKQNKASVCGFSGEVNGIGGAAVIVSSICAPCQSFSHRLCFRCRCSSSPPCACSWLSAASLTAEGTGEYLLLATRTVRAFLQSIICTIFWWFFYCIPQCSFK